MAESDELHCLRYQATNTTKLSRTGNFSASTVTSQAVGNDFQSHPLQVTPLIPSRVCLLGIVQVTDVALLPPRFSPWRNSVFHKHHFKCKNINESHTLPCKTWVLSQLSY